jgi:hypothetical protein
MCRRKYAAGAADEKIRGPLEATDGLVTFPDLFRIQNVALKCWVNPAWHARAWAPGFPGPISSTATTLVGRLKLSYGAHSSPPLPVMAAVFRSNKRFRMSRSYRWGHYPLPGMSANLLSRVIKIQAGFLIHKHF